LADNFTVSAPTSTGSTFAADEVAGVLHQRVKIQYGVDGAATDVCDATPLPVDDAGGTITVDDGGGALTVDGTVTAQVARTTSHIGATLSTDSLMNATTALTPKFASIGCAALGDNTLVAAVAGKKIRVLSMQILIAAEAGAAIGVYIHDSTPTDMYGDATHTIPMDNTGAAGVGGFTLPFSPIGWMETAANTNLVANLSLAHEITGCVVYVEV
jgi:hypothetical protein